MATGYIPLPSYKYPDNAMIDFKPINQAFRQDRGWQEHEQNAFLAKKQDARADEDQGMQRTNFGNSQTTFKQGQEDRTSSMVAKTALAAYNETDPAKKKLYWNSVLKRHPDLSKYGPEYLSEETGPKLALAEAGLLPDPMGQEKAKLGLDLTRAQIAKTNAQAAERTSKATTKVALESKLQELGYEPGSPEYEFAMINNKLPAKAFEVANAQRERDRAGEGLAGGLRNLKTRAMEIDDNTFSNTFGPAQGDESEGGVLSSLVPVQGITRLAGSAWNAVEGGKGTTWRARDSIDQAATTLASGVKRVVRGAGEGAWSDRDQMTLDKIVGNLKRAGDKQDFYKRLNDTRDAIAENWGIKINYDALKEMGAALPKEGGQGPPAAAAAAGADVVRSNNLRKKYGLE